MKPYLSILFLLLLCSFFVPFQAVASGGSEQKIELTMGSWRTDDVANLKAVLAEFTKRYPNITVQFQPTNPPDYNATLRQQLESGTGPDVMYARSFETGKKLYEDGYFIDLSQLKNIDTNYDTQIKAPWTSDDGVPFAIPFVAVSHGIYYNKDIFKKLNITIPTNWTWDTFLSIAQKIKAAGYIPIANSLADEWDIAEVVFMNIAPNFIGGAEGRSAYEEGKKKFDSPEIVALFKAMQSLRPFLPKGFEALTYNDSSALFATSQAAMYFDGSWSIGNYKGVDFEWGILPPPHPANTKKEYITFHPDAGIAINAKTKNREAAELLLVWLGSQEGAQALAKYLPLGFFPMSKNSVTITDRHANEFLMLNKGRGTDVRLPWPKLLGGEPSGYNLIMEGSIGVITGKITPQKAAQTLRQGLAKWYNPAR